MLLCGISGFRTVKGYSLALPPGFDQVLATTSRRGPDTMGWVSSTGMGPHRITSIYKHRLPRVPGQHLPENPNAARAAHIRTALDNSHAQTLVANFRGTPTTETSNTGEWAIQPYVWREHTLTHNGLFSNDEEVQEEHGWTGYQDGVDHDTDSYAVLHLIEAGYTFLEALDLLEGSQATVYYNTQTDETVLSRNYRGLHLAMVEDATSVKLVWASEREALEHLGTGIIWEMPLDSHLTVEAHSHEGMTALEIAGDLQRLTVVDPPRPNPSAVVVISGGLDSTVAATLACRRFSRVHLLHFDYGAHAGGPEEAAVRAIFDRLSQQFPRVKIHLEVMRVDFFRQIGGTTLIAKGDEPDQVADGERGVETAHEWVPFRNGVLMSIAAAYADRHNLGWITLGLNMEESSVYADNAQEFYDAWTNVLRIGTQSHSRVWMPVANLMKHHIALLAHEIGAPVDVSWSCYRGEHISCGRCGPDLMRQRAFAYNGLTDPIQHAIVDPVADKLRERYKRSLGEGD